MPSGAIPHAKPAPIVLTGRIGCSAAKAAPLLAPDPIWSIALRQHRPLPAQLELALAKQRVNGGVHHRHRVSPCLLRSSHGACHLARAHGRVCRSLGQQLQDRVSRACRHGFRRPLRDDRPAVIGSGLAGGFQPSGAVTCCRLVPSPIAPGR